jgi:hypothetical protein
MPREQSESVTTILLPIDAVTANAAGVTVMAMPAPTRTPKPVAEALPAEPPSRARGPHRDAAGMLALIALVALACAIARSSWFTAGSDTGYWIGVTGGTAMLLLFTYPLRKRWRAVRELGSTRLWFSFHMTLGIVGPLLIIVHSTLRFGSVNATVAFISMALVAGSGVMGRFLYAQIHHGLYGRRASLAELRERAGFDSAKLRSKLAFVPEVERQLNDFAHRAEETRHTGLVHPLRFLALGLHAAAARRRCMKETTEALQRVAARKHWSPEDLARRIERRRKLIARHLAAVQRVAQFAAFERLFSIWHVLHVPLVYMMVLSAIAHVIAVHMY